MKNTVSHAPAPNKLKHSLGISPIRKLGKEIFANRMIYTLLIPGIVWMIVFAYLPMGGLSLAFKDFNAKLGIWGSQWIGFENFKHLFKDPSFFKAVGRTLFINISKLLVTFPVPIMLALLFNEVRARRYSKVLQTIFTFPNFLSWIITSGIIINILSSSGLVNNILSHFGIGPINFLGSESAFVPLLYISEIWKSSGWNAIIYIAAISGIDQEQYEAAEIDGSTRLQTMFRITLPNIMPTIIVMFILATGSLMSSSFDQIFNLANPATKQISEVLDVYIYRITFQSATDFPFSTAVSLFRSIINMVLLLTADRVAKLLGGNGLFGSGGNRTCKKRKK